LTYQPDYYDAVTPASWQGDVEWYCRKAVEAKGPVLELGCGTGRITLPIAEAGVPIHALDASEAMLSTLRAKVNRQPPELQARVHPVVGDMRDFDLSERFALVIVPFRAFLHNVTEADRLACLACVRRHLRPGGRFAFNVFHPSLDFMANHAGALTGVWRWLGTHPLEHGGFVVRSDANRYDTVRQLVHSLHRYDEYGSDGVLVKTSMHRLTLAYLYAADIRRLLTDAGFTEIAIGGGFSGGDFAHDSDELVIEAR
jgi:SAM-dependent methyltransferase